MMLNRAPWCTQAFSSLLYVIIDEFHSFIGSERGCQLQSLLHRLEFLIQRMIPRIALSATLGDMHHIASFLRPGGNYPCHIIESTIFRSDLKIQLRGYLEAENVKDAQPSALGHIITDLYTILRGKSHLVFANSRNRTEEITAGLRELCELNHVPNEFFAHHGSLSKDIRESLEQRFQQNQLPTTAVCTMTLELGIDIGNVNSIGQVTAPHSVASLRQRLGRSGRRGEPAILRMFVPESELSAKSHLSDRLRVQTIQCIAMINLLLEKWYEPASDDHYHLSTLVQQTLSVIGQYGGVRADQLWSLLCKTGPFNKVDSTLYRSILQALGQHDLITQTSDGQLILGSGGERLVGHFTFYTAFNTPEEYTLEHDGHILGTVPIINPIVVDQHLIFAGKRWRVLSVNVDKKIVSLAQAKGGKPPMFDGGNLSVHTLIRQEMRRIYTSHSMPLYLDATAHEFLSEAMNCFDELALDKNSLLLIGNTVHVLPWQGDRITNTITLLLRRAGLTTDCEGGIIDIRNCTIEKTIQTIAIILKQNQPSPTELANIVPDTMIDKYDYLLPKEVRDIGYGVKHFDVEGAWKWLVTLHNEHSDSHQ